MIRYPAGEAMVSCQNSEPSLPYSDPTGSSVSTHRMDFVEVDGAIMKGGGQVLRNCSVYAALLGKPVRFVNIRANRNRNPGLRPQYIEGLEIVAKLSNCTVEDAFESSEVVSFMPRKFAVRDSQDSLAPVTEENSSAPLQIHTNAAATSLLLQASLPVLLFIPNIRYLVLTGGACMLITTSIDYTKNVLVPVLYRYFKATVEINIVRRDFMPRGDALVNVRTYPTESLPPICMRERGEVVRISSILYGYGKANQQFINRVEVALKTSLKSNGLGMAVIFSSDIQGSETEMPLVCRILIYAETSTGCILAGGGEHYDCTKPEELTSSAVFDFLKQLEHGGCTDEYLQDQLIIFMALADGVSEIVTGPITEHTQSALQTLDHMTDAEYKVTELDGGRHLIRIKGIGHSVTPTDSQWFGVPEFSTS